MINYYYISTNNNGKSSPIYLLNMNSPEFSNSVSQLDNFVQEIVEEEGHDQEQEDDYDEMDYEDIFEEARREQVLRDINQEESSQPNNEDVQEVLGKKARRQQKQQQYAQKQQMKKLRQQNALLFFRKVKMQLLLDFKDAILQATSVQCNYVQKVSRLLSHCSIDTVKSYSALKALPAQNRKRTDFKGLLSRIFAVDKIQLKEWAKYEIIWCLAASLGIGFRKICFTDISEMDLESFYNLKYLTTKNKNKSLSKQIDILKNRLQRKVIEEQLKDKNFVSLESYEYDPKAHIQNSQSASNISSQKSWSTKLEEIKQMKKSYINSFCEIYCPVSANWQLFNMEIVEPVEVNMLKTSILEGKAVIGFFYARILTFKDQYKKLANQRMTGIVEIRDKTIELCDKYELVEKRRYRLGCKNLYRNFIREANVFRNLSIFSEVDQILIRQEQDKQMEWAHKNFPKSVKQMKNSDYFVTASLVEKYMIIKEGALPLPDIQFHEEKVYHKSDLQRVSSRMGWIDCGRLVKQNQIPIKTTQNKNKSSTKLYRFTQTQPFHIRVDESGDLILDEDYNSIYVPPDFEIPPGYQLIPNNVEYLCKKNSFKCARIVQGFDVAGSHVVPNNIGFLVESKHRAEIEQMYIVRQEKLKQKKQERKIEGAMSLWRKLFKSIIITQQVHSR